MRQQGSAQFRPHSAKPGHKLYRGQSNAQDLAEQNSHKFANRKQIKPMRQNITSNDFARILPRKIQQDKQRLYSQALQLKENLNECVEENIRLKTKISILEREKDKMSKLIDNAAEHSGQKGSRINTYQNKAYEKDNMIVRNLKRIIKEYREQNDSIKNQNQKIKKMMKYTKINEHQIEKKMLTDENKRLSVMLEDYRSQFTDQQEIVRQNQQLKKYLQEELEQKQQVQQQREKYEQIIQSLQDKLRSEKEKYQNKEKRLVRDLNTEKKRAQELQKRNQDLIREMKYLKQSQQYHFDKHPKNTGKNSKNNIKDNSMKVNSQPSQSNLQWQNKYNDMKFKNQKLQQQLKDMKQQMKKAQIQIATLEQKEKSNSRFHINVSQLQNSDFNGQANGSQKPQGNRLHQEDNQYNQSYDQFQNQTKLNQHKNGGDEIQNYKKDFDQEDQEVQQLYKLEDQKPKQSKNNKQTKKKSKNKNEPFKPNKKILSEIKELLTYRMKAQRYPFSDIKSDIQSAESNTFSYIDLCNMFVNEPFYLTSEYTKGFLSYCYERQKIEPYDTISNSALVAKLRKVVDDFQLLDEEEQKEMIIKIAEMTSAYPTQLPLAFENIKNGQETVGRADLKEMFKKLELQDKYIELIISELSLCSDDLEHLNFHGFFERFYIQDDEDYIQNNAIQEQGQESEQSHKYSSRLKKQPVKVNMGVQEQEMNEENNHD